MMERYGLRSKSGVPMKPKNRCQHILWSILFCIEFLWTALDPQAFAQEGRTKIRISYPSVSIANLALFAAQQWNIFEQNGLEVESIQMRSQAANAASASGDIHYVAGVGPNSVAATLRGLPSKAVWFASERLVYSIVARPEFKSLKELRGKRIAVTGLGGTSEVVLRIGLEAAGENPKDFVIIGLGAAQLMNGLESGSIEAANFNPPFLYFAKRKGFRELLDSRRACSDAAGRSHGFQRFHSKSRRGVEANHPIYANRQADASSGERKERRFHYTRDQGGSRNG